MILQFKKKMQLLPQKVRSLWNMVLNMRQVIDFRQNYT